MFIRITSLFVILSIFVSTTSALARTKHSKKKSKNKSHKVTKHKRKSRHFRHGTGPDLKAITTESPFKEVPNNGVNPVEVKQPGI